MIESFQNIQTAARAYVEAGFKLVRLMPREKKPYSKAWQNAEPKPEQFEPNENIGVQLGSKSNGLVDLDFDIPQARALSGLACFFGHLPSFRRSSQPPHMPGHRLAICRDAPEKRESFDFRGVKEKAAIAPLNLAKEVVLELRVGGCQTAFPPSRLGDDVLVFDSDLNNLLEMSWSDLKSRAGLLAFSAFAAFATSNAD